MVANSKKHVRVELPNDERNLWNRLKNIYKSLENVANSKDLVSVLQKIYQGDQDGREVAEFHNEATGLPRNDTFNGLQIYLDRFASGEERSVFFGKTLPLITRLASKLDEHVPQDGVSVLYRQNPGWISLKRKFIASVLASGFLCVFTEHQSTNKTVNFTDLYAGLCRPELQDIQAAKLRFLLKFFERIANKEIDLDGEISFYREVVSKSFHPLIVDWEKCSAALCPLVVEHYKTIAESQGTMLQVDFSNCVDGGGILGPANKQEENHFCMNPEFLVATMFMESLEDNESLLIKHRFGGNPQAVVSVGFSGLPRSRDRLVLSALNKALVCFSHGNSTACHLIEMNFPDMNGREQKMDYGEDEDERNYEDDTDAAQADDQFEITYIEDEVLDVNGNIPVQAIDKLSVSLVERAFMGAFNQINIHSVGSQDVLENLMKKSVHEVFKKTPEKKRTYTERILNSARCPQNSREDKRLGSSLTPRTPPSTPAKGSLVSSQSGVLPDRVRLGTTGFADSLAESLMSCVLMSSSLVTSIAAATEAPLNITSVTMETFQKSPKKFRSSEKKDHRIQSTSILSALSRVDSKPLPHGGGVRTALFDTTAGQGVSLEPMYAENTEEDNEARRRSLTELALNLFEDFASKLASTIIKSATGVLAVDTPLGSIDEEYEDDERDRSRDSHRSNGSERRDTQRDEGDGEEGDFRDRHRSNGNQRDDIQRDDTDGREGDSRGAQCENETTDDKGGYSHLCGADFTDSDSEHDDEEFQWDGRDIDEEIEERLYKLDLTDEEEISNDKRPKSVTEMADAMFQSLFRDALPKAMIELEKNSKVKPDICTNGKESDDAEFQGARQEVATGHAPGFVQGDSVRIARYADELSVNIVQEAISESSTEAEFKLEDNVELYAEDSVKNTDFVADDFGVTNERKDLNEVDERREDEELTIKGRRSSDVNGNIRSNDAPSDLQKFVDVLASQLVQASVAIASASVNSQQGSVSVVSPIATGSWDYGGDPEMQAVVQWMAASVVGCPALVYHTQGNVKLEKLSKVQQVIRERNWRVCDVMQVVLRYYHDDSVTPSRSLFDALLAA